MIGVNLAGGNFYLYYYESDVELAIEIQFDKKMASFHIFANQALFKRSIAMATLWVTRE